MQRGNRFKGLDRGNERIRGRMNATEAEYAAELETRKRLGEIADYKFEEVGLRLTTPPEGKAVVYWPDFVVYVPVGVDEDGCVVHEQHVIDVKGSGPDNDASIVRLKCAAERHPCWRFFRVKKQRKRDGGGWHVTEY